ncbi:MAG: DMT family transporter [Gammaproteobacteria bacterium]|nr:DMT family transporter [Gammaproteobacteria bacterium]
MQTFSQRSAVLLIASSSLLISINGFMLRSIETANEWQVIFGRQIFFTPVILVALAIRYRGFLTRMFIDAGWVGLAAGVCLGLANPTVILAMVHTTVANALFTLSASPLITAVLAWMILRERLSRTTLIAIVFAMAGIGLMVADGLGGGTILGNLLALLCAFFFSLFVIFLRLGKDRNMLPSSVIGGAVGALVGLAGADWDYHLTLHDGLLCLFWGGGIVTVVHFLFIQGSRYVPGAEIMLITLIEFILGPMWVWIGFGERPSLLALSGGALVLLAVAGRSFAMLRGAENQD